MASALAHPLFRTSNLDQGLHTSTNGISDGDISQYHNPMPDPRLPSPLPPGPIFLKDLSRTSSASTQSSQSMIFQQPNFHTRSASLSQARAEEYNRQQQQQRSALPGLSALASLASTKEPHIRQVHATTIQFNILTQASGLSLHRQDPTCRSTQCYQCQRLAYQETTTFR